MSANTVRHEQVADLLGADTQINTRWYYTDNEPFAVTVAFCTENGRWVEWTFARDLLIEGLQGPAGIGDLRVSPTEDDDVLMLEIRSPGGQAAFELDRDATQDFVNATLELVPEGTESEHFDVERLLGEISGI